MSLGYAAGNLAQTDEACGSSEGAQGPEDARKSTKTSTASSRSLNREQSWTDVLGKKSLNFAQQKLAALEAADNEDSGKAGASTASQRQFNLIMGGAIVANIFWTVFEMDFGPDYGVPLSDRFFWFVGSSCFLLIFLFEIGVRMKWEKWRWVRAFWNWFDAVVVFCGILDVWVLPLVDSQLEGLKSPSILRLARLIRLVRTVKLVKKMHSLYVMVMALVHAVNSMLFLGTIMFFGELIYAIFMTVLIGRNSSFDDIIINGFSVDDRFGKVYRSMYSLFELMTLEGFETVCRPLMKRNPLCFLLFGSFIIIFTYGLLNLAVAAVVVKTLEQKAGIQSIERSTEMQQVTDELMGVKHIFTDSDEDQSSSLSQEEFESALLTNDVLRVCLENLGVSTNDATELFTVLDFDNNKELTIGELVSGIGKLKDGTASAWDSLATYADAVCVKSEAGYLKNQVSALEVRLEEHSKALHFQTGLLQEVLACVTSAPVVVESPQLTAIAAPMRG